MKKILVIFVTAVLALAIIPTISGIDGNINYNPGGGAAPVKILAIWETNGESWLDDDYYSPGCQIDPPNEYGEYSTVWVHVAVLDPDDDIQYNTQIKIDISWPDNDCESRPDLGDGSKAFDNLEPVLDATWTEYEAADAIDYGENLPFICYYNEANDGEHPEKYDYVHWQYYESNVKFFKAKYELYYHDPAGWYDAEITIQASSIDTQLNYFEYVYSLCVEPDFDYIDWGDENLLYIWHAYDGNWDWDDTEEPPLPTIRNVGNWDAQLGCHFGPGDFVVDDVLFDWRAGDSNPESPNYNPTYSEENSIPGMIPCNWDYYPLPIDNDPWLGEDTNYDDVLLKCHFIKLDFYIKVLQWTNGPGPYEFDIDIFLKDTPWCLPAPGYPCPNPPEPEPEADIGIQKTVDDSEPEINTDVTFTITVTNYGPDNATDIIVDDLLPDGLEYVSDNPSQGTYNYLTGYWDVGNLDNGEYATLDITATVTPAGSESEFVQLAILLDGSNSISDDDWDIMLEGLSDAIESCFPITGYVELTIIQFGSVDPAFAQVELEPIIVNSSNYMSIATNILSISKLGGATPTACAINLAADTLANSPNFDPENRQVINLVTDGEPNCICDVGEYTGVWLGNDPPDIAQGKASAEAARTYLLETLEMTAFQDEFDAEAVGEGPDVLWLRDYIVWPGNYEWTGTTPPGPGWVRQISDYTEFAATLCEKFAILFEGIENCASLINSNPTDPNTANDYDCVEITPQASPD